MSDLISREDVIRILSQRAEILRGEYGDLGGACSGAVKIIKSLPSVELERTAKVIEHDASITDDLGYKYWRSEYLCGKCKKKVIGGDEYCSHCGSKLDWTGLINE